MKIRQKEINFKMLKKLPMLPMVVTQVSLVNSSLNRLKQEMLKPKLTCQRMKGLNVTHQNWKMNLINTKFLHYKSVRKNRQSRLKNLNKPLM